MTKEMQTSKQICTILEKRVFCDDDGSTKKSANHRKKLHIHALGKSES
jgi:hypothetical protein